MAHIARRRTVGRAQDLYNDLLENLYNHKDYTDKEECKRDDKLAVLLHGWLLAEMKREA